LYIQTWVVTPFERQYTLIQIAVRASTFATRGKDGGSYQFNSTGWNSSGCRGSRQTPLREPKRGARHTLNGIHLIAGIGKRLRDTRAGCSESFGR
jgi:hypothetical protein